MYEYFLIIVNAKHALALPLSQSMTLHSTFFFNKIFIGTFYLLFYFIIMPTFSSLKKILFANSFFYAVYLGSLFFTGFASKIKSIIYSIKFVN